MKCSNAQQRKSFENNWDSTWVVPRISQPQQIVVPSIDCVHVLAKRSPPYSSFPSAAWPKPHALIQCGAKNMTLRISKRGSSPLHVNQDGSWVTVFQKLPQCSSTMSRRRRSLWPPHYGCDISKKDGQTFPVRVAGTPLVIGCPFPPRSPPVDCTAGLLLRLGGVSVVDLKIKVMGYWYPLMAVCRWCALSVELRGGELSLKAPFKGACTETKDGVHTISLQSKDAEMAFSCSPPPPTYPPYPFGHAHLPWLNVPHVHPPTLCLPLHLPSHGQFCLTLCHLSIHILKNLMYQRVIMELPRMAVS
ncbi:hypothetical protein SKAU_G00175070 [Synaphobranchus kaupii]|uniref:Uncharacterized protein n=1 Tax=Synaphobranchus kaupii TaxID=118154 RepID=A0A9Q1FL38_SYNKA|nr:hypothetical protein SKAU_G00175070 [Synaphobranchus kaupii]